MIERLQGGYFHGGVRTASPPAQSQKQRSDLPGELEARILRHFWMRSGGTSEGNNDA